MGGQMKLSEYKALVRKLRAKGWRYDRLSNSWMKQWDSEGGHHHHRRNMQSFSIIALRDMIDRILYWQDIEGEQKLAEYIENQRRTR